jgi:hypothetical protein
MEFSENTKELYKKRIINMIFKLLPMRDEGADWLGYLDSVIEEFHEMDNLFEEIEEFQIAILLAKLEGLKILTGKKDFYLFRKTILECTNLIK